MFSLALRQYYSRQELSQHHLPFLVTMNVAVSHFACSAFPTGQERNNNSLLTVCQTKAVWQALGGYTDTIGVEEFLVVLREKMWVTAHCYKTLNINANPCSVCSLSVNNPYVSLCPAAHKPLRSSLRPQSKGFPKERFLNMVLTRIYKIREKATI